MCLGALMACRSAWAAIMLAHDERRTEALLSVGARRSAPTVSPIVESFVQASERARGRSPQPPERLALRSRGAGSSSSRGHMVPTAHGSPVPCGWTTLVAQVGDHSIRGRALEAACDQPSSQRLRGTAAAAVSR